MAVSPDTLDPRADTETLIEAVVAAIPDRTRPLRLLDLGTGTGAILLALLAEYKEATGLGVDLSLGALGVRADQRGESRAGLRAPPFVFGQLGRGP